jgi:hypothetical protein
MSTPDSKPRKGFLDLEGLEKLHDSIPGHLQTTVIFLDFTGCPYGAAAKIAWDMASKDGGEIER